MGYFLLFFELPGESGKDIAQAITECIVLKIRNTKDPFGAFQYIPGRDRKLLVLIKYYSRKVEYSQ